MFLFRRLKSIFSMLFQTQLLKARKILIGDMSENGTRHIRERLVSDGIHYIPTFITAMVTIFRVKL